MYQAVIFDLDGTLADTVESIAYSANRALKFFGYSPHPVEKYQYFAGDGAPVLIKRALNELGETNQDKINLVLHKFREYFKKDSSYKVKLFPNMKETLDELKAKGYKIAVLSNKPHINTLDVIDYLFEANYFDFVKGHTEDVPKKPDPAGAFYVADQLKITPEQCIYVGDTNTDMETGKAAHMFTVGVLWGFRTEDELTSFSPDAIIKDPLELLEIDIISSREV